jgi:hypothetical protein
MQFYRQIKKIVKSTFIYSLWCKYKHGKYLKGKLMEEKLTIKLWEKNGMPVPPPQRFKQLVIKEYANKYKTTIFIETGTYLGETIDYCKSIFKKVISIELDVTLFNNAKHKFAHENKINIYNGDSGILLEKVLTNIEEPCLFWLDGHYSEGMTAKGELNTPIINELNHIFNHQIDNHVVLIDDARCFTGEDDYPTLDYLRDFIYEKDPNMQFKVENDIIRIHK